MQDIEKLKEWQAVMKRVENDKLREEQEGRSRDLLAAEHRRSALEKVLAKLQVRVGLTSASAIMHKMCCHMRYTVLYGRSRDLLVADHRRANTLIKMIMNNE